MVSVTDPYCLIVGFLDRTCLYIGKPIIIRNTAIKFMVHRCTSFLMYSENVLG
jgi:hypothetical protein